MATYRELQRSPPRGCLFHRRRTAAPGSPGDAGGRSRAGTAGQAGRCQPLGTGRACRQRARIGGAGRCSSCVATPLHYLRESLTSPTNLAVFLPIFDDGTVPARLLGAVDLFGLWWVWLLALGLHAAAGRPARRYLGDCWSSIWAWRLPWPVSWRSQEGLSVFRKKWVWAVLVVAVIGGIAAFWFNRRQDKGITVTAETIQRRDLEAIVSASGKIEPQKTVNISAQSMGRVTRLAVERGRPCQGRPVPAADRRGGGGGGGAARRGGGGRRPDGAGAVTRVPAERPGQPRARRVSRSSGSRS